jgi:hypothetical protein
MPSIFLCFTLLTPALLFIEQLRWPVVILWVLYLIAMAKAFCDIYSLEKNLYVTICSLCYIFPTHLNYGLQFIKGFLFKKKLYSKLRE